MKIRGRCPTVLAPVPTGDGLLVRLAPLDATLSLAAAIDLCGAARQCGNGVIEVTSRGNLQFRGLRPKTHPLFAARLAARGLSCSAGVPVLTNPLANIEADAARDLGVLVHALRMRLAGAPLETALAGKVSVVVDSGSALHLDALAADVRLRATASALHVAVAGDGAAARDLGEIAVADGIGAVLRILALIAGERRRARDIICSEGLAPFRRALGGLLHPEGLGPPLRPPAEPIGVHALRDGTVALGVALPFGHTHQELLATLLAEAERAGAAGLRLAPRGLLIVGLAAGAVAPLRAAAQSLGLIVAADDRRRQVVLCPGAPFCDSGEIATRNLGARIAKASAPLLDGSLQIHVSGCAKGCALVGKAAVTIVGRCGQAALVIDGDSRDAPMAVLEPQALPAALAALAAQVVATRYRGEPAAAALRRLRFAGELSRLFAANG